MQKTQVQSLGQQDPLKESMATQLQYSCLGNSMDRGVWWIMVHGVTRSWTWLSDFHFQLSRFIKLIPWNVFSVSNLVFDLAVRRLELVVTVNDLQICMVYRSDYLKWFRTGSNREWINSKANHSFLLLLCVPIKMIFSWHHCITENINHSLQMKKTNTDQWSDFPRYTELVKW